MLHFAVRCRACAVGVVILVLGLVVNVDEPLTALTLPMIGTLADSHSFSNV